jgi:hypothetical protein
MKDFFFPIFLGLTAFVVGNAAYQSQMSGSVYSYNQGLEYIQAR